MLRTRRAHATLHSGSRQEMKTRLSICVCQNPSGRNALSFRKYVSPGRQVNTIVALNFFTENDQTHLISLCHYLDPGSEYLAYSAFMELCSTVGDEILLPVLTAHRKSILPNAVAPVISGNERQRLPYGLSGYIVVPH